MNCIILGDKYQNGMKSKGCPALVKITNKINIITHQCSILESLKAKIIYIYGFDDRKFIDYYSKFKIPIQIVYNENYNNYNQAFSLSLVKDVLAEDECLIIDGYQKLNKSIIKKITQSTDSAILVNKNTKRDEEAVGCIINQDKVMSFSLDLNNIIEGIYYLNKDSSLSMSKLLLDAKNYNHFIFELLNKIIDQGNGIKPILV